jgi:hypothetical protein
MRINSSGNVGIGTSYPSAKLHIYGDSSSTSAIVGAYISNGNIAADTQSGVGFFNYDNFSAKIYSPRTGSTNGRLVFATNNGGGIAESNVVERARITESGNLLVGTTSITGSTSNYAQVVAGLFTSLRGELNNLSTNTVYTIFDAGAAYSCYLVSVIGIAGDAGNYSATAVVNIQNTSVSISYIDTGGLIFITNSGTAIRVNQNSGTTMGNLIWTALKIA